MKYKTLLLFAVLTLSACHKRSEELMVIGKAPSFSLTNQEGKNITNDFYSGKVYVCEFFFTTCPTICPLMTRHLADVDEKFKEEYRFGIASFTVDPETDTPKVLKAYAENLKVPLERWNFLTGDPQIIYNLATKGFFVTAQPNKFAPGGFLHSQYFILIDKQGNIRAAKDVNGNPVFYDGTRIKDVARLEQDIKALLRE